MLVILGGVVTAHLTGHAHAQSSLGIGANEATLPSTGLFSHWLNLINFEQQRFYRALTGAMKGMRQDGGQVWLLIGLSFAYGIFHAAGPGHGKAVISSYMLANDVALRRGVMLSFVSSFLQALVAILMISALFLFLRGTAVTMTNATWFLEVASYALVMCFGAWLLWQKIAPLVHTRIASRPAHSLSAAATVRARDHGHHDHSAHSHDHGHAHDHHDHGHDHHGHDHAHPPHGQAGHVHDEHCGHAHAPDPAMLSGDRFSWRTAWSAVAAVGLRPCSGALIVLTFAFLNGIWAGGILSVLAMALGTAITVSTLAILAVKSFAVKLAGGESRTGAMVHRSIEIGGAALVFLLGLLLLLASLREYHPGG